MDDKQRASFEAWIKTHCDYDDLDRSEMMLAFDAWQAALESPEVQALRKDAERYRWIRDPCSGADLVILYSRGDYGKGFMSGGMLDAAIDAAMEKQK